MIDEDIPREVVVHEREIVTERRGGGLKMFFGVVFGLLVVAVIVVIIWLVVDDGDSNGTVDDVREQLGDAGNEIRDEVNDATDG